jgi:S1-C subfamily serine protease
MSLLPPKFPDAVVAIGTQNKEGKFEADSTGFLVGFEAGKNEKNETLYEVLLVTNRHVFANRDSVMVRFGAKKVVFPLKDSEGILWTAHKDNNVDIAVSLTPIKELNQLGIALVWFAEDLFATKDKMRKEGIRTGDEIFVLGFPLGIAGLEKNYPIVRSGIIARLDEEVLQKHHYYIDVAIYGGNSGGPVILKPSLISTNDTPAVNKAYVIGIVSSVEMQAQILYGERNGALEKRMVIYEHSGLGRVIPVDYVKETVQFLKERISQKKLKTSETTQQ